jgi:hypothetical protein
MCRKSTIAGGPGLCIVAGYAQEQWHTLRKEERCLPVRIRDKDVWGVVEATFQL